MTTQEDFGSSSDKELVPSGLRGFRLFRVIPQFGDGTNDKLTSMVRTKDWPEESWAVPQVASCAYSRIVDVVSAPCECARGLMGKKELDVSNYSTGRLYHCSCKPKEPTHSPIFDYYASASSHPLYLSYEPVVEQAVVRAEPWHFASAPEQSCQCGFYGSYEPMTLVGAPGCNVYWPDKYCLGVVEASGRVIMGSCGFRAEKMRIVDTSPVEVVPGGFPGLHTPTFDPEFLEKYPPDDLSGLLPEREKAPPDVAPDYLGSNHVHWTVGYGSPNPMSPSLWHYYWTKP